MNEVEVDTKTMTYIFFVAAVAIVGIYFWYTIKTLKQQEEIGDHFKATRMGGSSSPNNSHSSGDEGGVVIFPVTDKTPTGDEPAA